MPNLTAEQQTVVRGIVKAIKAGDEQTINFSGAAGTGKSTCLRVLSEALPGFTVCAYTGKACEVLRHKGMTANTIHSLIYKPILLFDKVKFVLKDANELNFEGFLIDESSMISKEIYDDLLSFNKPIVFVGDDGQLEPIGQDIHVMANPMFRLTKIHRNAGEIAFFAEHLSKGKSARTFKSDKKIRFLEPRDVPDEDLLGVDQIICAFNRTRCAKNEKVRELLGRTKLVEVGERIICLRNNKPFGLFNGMQGDVTRVDLKRSKFDFKTEDGTYVDIFFDSKQFGKEKNNFEFGLDSPNPFDYAFTITTHKAQGSQFDKVMVFEQHCDLWSSQRWMYTAASRAINSLVWVCEKKHYPAWLV